MTKTKGFLALALAAVTAHFCAAQVQLLPDACGKDNVKFKIEVGGAQPLPASPGADKAQLVLIQRNEGHGGFGGISPTRFGLDGAWVGANQDNSYFVVTVAPGEHHLCVTWDKEYKLTPFTAEAGKVYYFEAHTVYHSEQLGNSRHPNLQIDKSWTLSALNEDDGKARMKLSGVSVSTPKN